MSKKIWVSAADHEEQGSFSDVESQNLYHNVSGIEKESQVIESGDRGVDAIIVDDTADPDDSYGVDQRFNIYRTEEDSQGTDRPAKHRVGGQ